MRLDRIDEVYKITDESCGHLSLGVKDGCVCVCACVCAWVRVGSCVDRWRYNCINFEHTTKCVHTVNVCNLGFKHVTKFPKGQI